MRIIASLTVLAACAGLAAAGSPGKVRWADSWESALAEAEDRNVPILVFFLREDEAGKKIVDSVLSGSRFNLASRKFVSIYCNADGGQPVRKRGDRSESLVTPAIPVEKHVEAWDALKPVFFGESEPTTPAAIWCSPDGAEIGRLTGNFTSRQLRLRLADAVDEVGPSLGADDYDLAIEALAAGRRAADQNRFSDAIREFGAVMALKGLKPAAGLVRRAARGLDDLEDAGRVRFKVARECIAAEDYARALSILKDVAMTYRGLPVAVDAEESWRETLALVEAIEKHRKSGGTGIDPRTGR